jgi:hypothetical protein
MNHKNIITPIILLITILVFGQKKIDKPLGVTHKISKNYIDNSLIDKKKLNKRKSFLKSIDNSKLYLTKSLRYDWDDNTNNLILDDDKEEYAYGSNGNITQYVKSHGDNGTDWYFDDKAEYTYNTNGNMLTASFYEWGSSRLGWITDSKYENTYDINGNRTQSIFYFGKNSKDWRPSTKTENFYNSENKITETYSSSWYDSASSLVLYEKSENSYNSKGNLILTTGYSWQKDLNRWEESYKYSYDYDLNEKLILRLALRLNENTNEWENNLKTEYTYDSLGNELSDIIYKWNSTDNIWEIQSKYEYTYNSEGYLIQKNTGRVWRETDNGIEYGNAFDDYIYDSNRNLIEHQRSSKFPNDPTYYSTRYTYNYDLSYTLSDLFLPYSYLSPEEINNKPLEYIAYYWDDTNNDWINERKKIYYYSEENILTVKNTEPIKIALYPNPVLNEIKFNLTNESKLITFELFDFQGRKIISKKINENEKLNLEYLNSGIYIYYLIVGEKKQKGKLIKK